MDLIAWIFNIGYLFQHIGTILQIKRIENKKSIEGVSIDTQILFLIGAIARYFWVSDTILKLYNVTYVELFLAVSTLLYTLYICLFKFNKFRSVFSLICGSPLPVIFRWWVLFIPASILSYYFFPGKENPIKLDIQMLVSLNIYIEAAGLIPQIYTVISEKDSRIFSSFYLIFLAVSRLCRLLFWVKMFLQTNDFEFLIMADLLHLIIFIVFVYFYFSNFDKLLLPTNDSRKVVGEKKIF
jgi:ER lumen protein retaining receptor